MERFHVPLTVYALKWAGHRDSAADVVQEVFLRLCKADPAEVRPHLAQWLYTVCRNLAIDVRRRESRMHAIGFNQASEQWSTRPGPVEQVEERDSLSQAMGLLLTLPGNQQEVLRLKFQHNLSYREIAAVTKLSESNVGFLIHTGLKSLRQKMTPRPVTGTSHQSKRSVL